MCQRRWILPQCDWKFRFVMVQKWYPSPHSMFCREKNVFKLHQLAYAGKTWKWCLQHAILSGHGHGCFWVSQNGKWIIVNLWHIWHVCWLIAIYVVHNQQPSLEALCDCALVTILNSTAIFSGTDSWEEPPEHGLKNGTNVPPSVGSWNDHWWQLS
jgi:hypothetical protein